MNLVYSLKEIEFGIVSGLILFLMTTLVIYLMILHIYLRKKGSGVFGRYPISSRAYKLGKIFLILCWVAVFLQTLGINLRFLRISDWIITASLVVYVLGFFLIFISYYYVGQSFRVGLPKDEVDLKMEGVYKFSRNPIYIGLYLTVIASMVFTFNPVVWILGIVSIYFHHRMIKIEETYLEKKLSTNYKMYCKRVGRYI